MHENHLVKLLNHMLDDVFLSFDWNELFSYFSQTKVSKMQVGCMQQLKNHLSVNVFKPLDMFDGPDGTLTRLFSQQLVDRFGDQLRKIDQD